MSNKNNSNISINLILLFILFGVLNIIGNSINGFLGTLFHFAAFAIPAYLIVMMFGEK